MADDFVAASWNFPSMRFNSDVLVGGQPDHFLHIRRASRLESNPLLHNPVFSNCTLPVIFTTHWPYNFGEVVARLVGNLDVFLRKKPMADNRVTLVLATPLGLGLLPFHDALLAPFSARGPPVALGELEALAGRPRWPAAWAAEGVAVGCFETALYCQFGEYVEGIMDVARSLLPELLPYLPPDPLGFGSSEEAGMKAVAALPLESWDSHALGRRRRRRRAVRSAGTAQAGPWLPDFKLKAGKGPGPGAGAGEGAEGLRRQLLGLGARARAPQRPGSHQPPARVSSGQARHAQHAPWKAGGTGAGEEVQPLPPLRRDPTFRVALEARTEGATRNILNVHDLMSACMRANAEGFHAGRFSGVSCRVLTTRETPELHGVNRVYANIAAARSAHLFVAVHGAAAVNAAFMEEGGHTGLLEIRPCFFGSEHCDWANGFMYEFMEGCGFPIRVFGYNVEDPRQCRVAEYEEPGFGTARAADVSCSYCARDQHIRPDPTQFMEFLRYAASLLDGRSGDARTPQPRSKESAFGAAYRAHRTQAYALPNGSLALGGACHDTQGEFGLDWGPDLGEEGGVEGVEGQEGEEGEGEGERRHLAGRHPRGVPSGQRRRRLGARSGPGQWLWKVQESRSG
ncbi:hypothetical protein HYH03_004272 [Edaphochlamys debaryana]|uniref:Uncharacterized protein n=1 Tax=Edaphochlamys debaryana TaxID=47281 RepID=A0A835YA91_9CHLO|nr:hypothetical protein HYH03_004272 [Edaphochlamys debaryana]|eukprot:KAG2498014.1 hypothetical protein HYH03_004272 [Edaphochlamys debaryana]